MLFTKNIKTKIGIIIETLLIANDYYIIRDL